MKAKQQLFIFALAVVLTLTASSPTVFSQDNASPSPRIEGNSIEGVWKNRITVNVCGTNIVLAQFPGLLTFHQGGTMTETDGTNPALRGPGHGKWTRISGRSYQGSFTHFTFNADGTLSGSFQVNQNLVLSADGNSLNDTATADILNSDGNLIATVCATANATRF